MLPMSAKHSTRPSILVTGATGNVGAEVIKNLQQLGQPVTAAVRNRAKAQSLFGETVNCIQFDFKQPATFNAAFKDVEKVFLVRPPDISNTKKYIDPFIRAAQQAGVEQIVFLSLLGAENNKVVPHYKIEQSLLASGMAWTFLRASFFMQNLDTTHREEIRKENEIFVPAGRGKTSFIDVRDIAAVATQALTQDVHKNKAYDLTGKEALDYYEVARHFSEVLGRPIRYSKPSAPHFLLRMLSRKTPLSFSLVMLAIYSTARLGLAAKVTEDTGRILGRAPLTMRQYIEDYRQAWI